MFQIRRKEDWCVHKKKFETEDVVFETTLKDET